MPVKHLGAAYDFPPANRVENYGGDWNIYIFWKGHLFLPCPPAYRLPPDMNMREFLTNVFLPDYRPHPDVDKVDWDNAEWTYEGKPWHPELDKSLRENGLGHMSYLQVRTPGAEGMFNAGY